MQENGTPRKKRKKGALINSKFGAGENAFFWGRVKDGFLSFFCATTTGTAHIPWCQKKNAFWKRKKKRFATPLLSSSSPPIVNLKVASAGGFSPLPQLGRNEEKT